PLRRERQAIVRPDGLGRAGHLRDLLELVVEIAEAAFEDECTGCVRELELRTFDLRFARVEEQRHDAESIRELHLVVARAEDRTVQAEVAAELGLEAELEGLGLFLIECNRHVAWRRVVIALVEAAALEA